ncbi:MAG: hypothetical protein IJN39_07055 [Clostridia bacterium]|nr:hypothetical protein [Clostridia bacterium]
MDLFLEFSVLFDYYGTLLTEMQQNICDMYYNQNLSLTEIAEDLEITKQGVRDALKKSEKLLLKYENNLHIREKNEQISNFVQSIEEMLTEATITDENKDRIRDLAEQINSLI